MRRSPISAPLLVSTAVLLTTLGGCGMSTYGTGEAPEMALFREMGGGILNKNKKKEPIEYQPRAPLVMPPSAADTATAQLPAPMETASAASPDWPVSMEDRIAPATARSEDDDPRNDINQAEYRRLRPLAGVFPEQQASPVQVDESGKTEYYDSIVHGRRQREEFKQALAESKGYGGTERRFLTDPPLIYREPVAEAPGVEPVVPKKKKGNFLTRWWSGG